MNNTLITVLVILVLGAVLLGAWWLWNNPAQTQNQSSQTGAQGTLYLTITDAAANMAAISAVNMTIDKVYLHSATQGWVTVSSTPQTFNLLALKESGRPVLLVKANVTADTYDQVWLHVSSVNVTESGRAKSAALPSNEVKMNTTVKVPANANASAAIDFIASDSLHKTAKQELIFAPVVKVESRSNANVIVAADNAVYISGGSVDTNITLGMDVSGEMKDNFKVDSNAVLQLNNGVINIQSSAGTSAQNRETFLKGNTQLQVVPGY